MTLVCPQKLLMICSICFQSTEMINIYLRVHWRFSPAATKPAMNDQTCHDEWKHQRHLLQQQEVCHRLWPRQEKLRASLLARRPTRASQPPAVNRFAFVKSLTWHLIFSVDQAGMQTDWLTHLHTRLQTARKGRVVVTWR